MGKTSQHSRKTQRDLQHDHNACVQIALSHAEKRCAEDGERFTGLRRQVLELVWSEHKPAKAYDLLATLSSMRSGVAPTTVYRTLDFLQERGLVHKIESLNAYVGCSQPDTEHSGHFLICEACSEIKEIENTKVSSWLEQAARDEDFIINSETVELFGLCIRCQLKNDERATSQK